MVFVVGGENGRKQPGEAGTNDEVTYRRARRGGLASECMSWQKNSGTRDTGRDLPGLV